jgi:hypothetical protein
VDKPLVHQNADFLVLEPAHRLGLNEQRSKTKQREAVDFSLHESIGYCLNL